MEQSKLHLRKPIIASRLRHLRRSGDGKRAFPSSGRSYSTRSRGRSAGRGRRPRLLPSGLSSSGRPVSGRSTVSRPSMPASKSPSISGSDLDDTLTVEGLPDPLLAEIRSNPPRPSDDFGEKVDVVYSRITPHQVPVVLRNEPCGIAVSFDYSQPTLPNLAVWRAYQSGIFALGIEPRTDIRLGDDNILAPGESRLYRLALRLADIDGASRTDR